MIIQRGGGGLLIEGGDYFKIPRWKSFPIYVEVPVIGKRTLENGCVVPAVYPCVQISDVISDIRGTAIIQENMILLFHIVVNKTVS